MLPVDGILRNERATLYKCPAGIIADLDGIYVVNGSEVSRKVNLYQNVSGQSRRICPVDSSMPPGYLGVERGPIRLQAGMSIEGDADGDDGRVTFVVQGRESNATV